MVNAAMFKTSYQNKVFLLNRYLLSPYFVPSTLLDRKDYHGEQEKHDFQPSTFKCWKQKINQKKKTKINNNKIKINNDKS